jgi:site-specific DNA-methyltransferase (adenine-specific)
MKRIDISYLTPTLICGECLNEMKKLPNNSIDTIITDPPYGLSFMNQKWDYDVPSIEIWKECLRVLKPGGTALIFAGSRTQHRMAINIEDAGFILKDTIMWLYAQGFPKSTDISKQLDKGHKRKIIGIKTDGRGKSPQKLNNHIKGDTRIGHADGSKKIYTITKSTTPEAKLWNGWRSHGLKPAYEPIIIAMKPNNGTYANNALIYGVSGIYIDGVRIPTNEDCGRLQKDGPCPPKYGFNNNKMGNRFQPGNTKGRYPANIILDEEAGKILDKQSGIRPAGKANGNAELKKIGINTPFKRGILIPRTDTGGASRFFYCAKASKKERGEGNTHPTIKPLKLMEYLCTLTKTPTGGVVLDPFMGSGTTGLACRNTKRKFIGIEIDKEYFKIAKRRLKCLGLQK